MLTRILNLFYPSESIEEAKTKWNKWAIKDARYAVLSLKKKVITDKDIDETGLLEYKKYVEPILPLVNKNKALEVGCGIGRLTQYLVKDFKTVTALDISPNMIEIAKTRANADYLVGDGENYSLPDNTYDFAFSYIVFQHMQTKKLVRNNFKEIIRVLKKGGIAKIHIGTKLIKKSHWSYGVVYTRNEAYELISSLGVKILSIEEVVGNGMWIVFQKN